MRINFFSKGRKTHKRIKYASEGFSPGCNHTGVSDSNRKKIKIMVLLLFALFPWPLLKEFVYVLQITSIEELERAEIFAFFFGDYA